MSFSLQLAQDLVPVEPGATVPVAVTVINRGTEQDQYELEVEGVDVDWKAVPVPVFHADPDEVHSERFFLKPPRVSESIAGNYPFVVRVRSLVTGEVRTAQGVLQVKPYHHLTMEISPKKGYVSPTRKQNGFDLTIVNLGNSEHTLQLTGSDPEDDCAYEFEQDHVAVGPGQQRQIEVVANPRSTPFFSSGRLIGFTVTGRSTDAPNVVASAQAQLEQRSLLSPTSLGVLIVLALILGLWLLNMPKKPAISTGVDRLEVMQGQPVTVHWTATDASQVKIFTKDDIIYQGPTLSGNETYTPTTSGDLVVHAQASKDGNVTDASDLSVKVDAPPHVDPPAIERLHPDKTRVRLGESFILEYAFNKAVVKATLGPTGEDLPLDLTSKEITPAQSGTITYEVVAQNQLGQTDKRTFKVQVYEESDAKILDFRPSTEMLPPGGGPVTLTWQVTNAVRIELKSSNGDMQVVEGQGSRDFNINAKTSYTLVAYDTKARTTSKTVTVRVAPTPKPPEPPVNPTDGTGTTAGTDGSNLPPSTVSTGGGMGATGISTTG